jgi:tRNA(Ile)-lysidine synthase
MMLDGVVLYSDPISEDEAATLLSLMAPEPALVLAVSGGPDSTALLWLAARWRRRLKRRPKLLAVTVDHGLRKESAREALAVKKLAKRLKVEHRTLRWRGKKPKTGIQEAARHARYQLLGDAARTVGAEYVLTAHTLDDQAETVLFRLLRGSGLTGLRGMRPGSPLPGYVPRTPQDRCFVQRPFLDIPKSRLLATLAAAKVPFADDPSNRDPRFTRPRLRALMPRLAKEGLTAKRLGLLAYRVTRVEMTFYDLLNEALRRLTPGPWPDKGPIAIDANAFADLSDEIALRLLGRIVEWVGKDGPVELGKLEILCADLRTAVLGDLRTAAFEEPGRFRRTLAGAMVTLSGAKITIEPAPPRRAGAKSGKRRVKAPFTKPR